MNFIYGIYGIYGLYGIYGIYGIFFIYFIYGIYGIGFKQGSWALLAPSSHWRVSFICRPGLPLQWLSTIGRQHSFLHAKIIGKNTMGLVYLIGITTKNPF